MSTNNLDFIRSDLSKLEAYIPTINEEISQTLDILDANESPFDLPLELKEKLANIYQQQINNNRYPNGSYLDLKLAIANYVNQSGKLEQNTILKENISIGNGSDELIRSILIATCLNDQGSILVANPTFSMYQILAETLGIQVINIERLKSDFSIDLKLANNALNNSNSIKIIFIVNPNSPTGNCLNNEEIKWLEEIPKNILVVIDEAYFEFSNQSLINKLNQHSNWLILRTFSKAFRLASHRVGYAIANSEIIKILEKIRLPYNLPSFSQKATQLVLDNSNLILNSVKNIIEERDRLYQILQKNSSLKIWKSDANFLYLQLAENSTYINLKQIKDNLQQQGTLIRHTGGGLRITIGTPKENDLMLARMNKIINQLNS